ncbi:MAG: hypothetical protein ACREFQ_13090 [Stellaceae bacterium]
MRSDRAAKHRQGPNIVKDCRMADLLMVAGAAAFFASAILYALACEKM